MIEIADKDGNGAVSYEGIVRHKTLIESSCNLSSNPEFDLIP